MSILSSTIGQSDSKKAAARVVAFLADHASEGTVSEVFSDLNMPYTLVRRGGVNEAIDYLGENESPKTLIVDVADSEMPLSEVNNLAEACEPGVTVIIIGNQNDIGLFRDLIQLGVSDYLAKPITGELIKRSLTSAENGGASSPVARQRSGKLIAVTGARGGVGATTVVSNLGWLLANEVHRRVAMVDLDTQFGSLSLAFDQKPSKGLREALENHHRVDTLFVERAMTSIDQRLFLLGGEESLQEPVSFDTRSVDTLVEILEKQFHYVMVDVPRMPGPVHRHVLQTADIRVVVAEPSVASVRDTIRLLGLMGKDEVGRRTIVILNRRTQASNADISVQEFEKAIGRKVDHVIPFGKGSVNAAGNSGEVVASRRGPVTDSLTDLAFELSGRSNAKVKRFSNIPFAGVVIDFAERARGALGQTSLRNQTANDDSKSTDEAKRA
jgi:pilus assembly protein CpaE